MGNAPTILLGRMPGKAEELPEGGFLSYKGNRHLLTLATKATDIREEMIIPNLLQYTGSIIISDPSGEYFRRTAVTREQMGHKILKLDPFGVIDEHTDSFNPFDVLKFSGDNIVEDINIILEAIFMGKSTLFNFWDDHASDLLRGVILYLATIKPEECSIGFVLDMLLDNDIALNLAVVLQTYGDNLSAYSRHCISRFLKENEITRIGIVYSTVCHFVQLSTTDLRKTLGKTSFDLEGSQLYNLFSIYIIIPEKYQKPYNKLYNLWIGAFYRLLEIHQGKITTQVLLLITTPTVFHKFTLLKKILQYGQPGIQIWSFWNSLSQIKSYYDDNLRLVLSCNAVLQLMNLEESIEGDEFNSLFNITLKKNRSFFEKHYAVFIENKAYLNVDKIAPQTGTIDADINTLSITNFIPSVFLNKKMQQFHINVIQPGDLCSTIFIDLDALYFNSTHLKYQESGYQIIKIDPLNITGSASESFNPLDSLLKNETLKIEDIYCFVENILSQKIRTGIFWETYAKLLLAGLIKYHHLIKRPLNLSKLKDLLNDKITNTLASFEKKIKSIDQATAMLLGILSGVFKAVANDKEKSLITDLCIKFLSCLDSPNVRKSLNSTSFDLDIIKTDKPFSLYLILPPSKVKSHGILLRFWISALIQLLADRGYTYNNKVLFWLDCAAEAGNIPFYQNVGLSSKSKNIQLWTFWESLSELQKVFPDDWETILGNCSRVQAFGTQKPIIAHDLAPVMGLPADELRRVPVNEHLVRLKAGRNREFY